MYIPVSSGPFDALCTCIFMCDTWRYMYMTSKQYIQCTIYCWYVYAHEPTKMPCQLPRCLSMCVKAYLLLNAAFPPNSFQSSANRPGQSKWSVSWLIHFSSSFHGKPSNHTRNQKTLGCLETWLFASIHVAPRPMLWWNILHTPPLGVFSQTTKKWVILM